MAPACEVEAGEEGPTYVAFFDDFPTSADRVARLIEEAWDLREVRMTLDGRSIGSRINFYVVLLCYCQSLNAPDQVTYCLQQSAKVGPDRGCTDRSCVSHCQFMCSRCIGLSRYRRARPIPLQLAEIARQAEVDWCPNLRIAKTEA